MRVRQWDSYQYHLRLNDADATDVVVGPDRRAEGMA